ncbi:membrane-spanning 4-domains subfamily A member 12-like isoform X2 [Chamaea fasciata]|uniref:membrane-spanning 4-domains subfamily A member 12-like isoform X2 n=1 Tax=Chamaea fasciata TaxID=190680 RepID=UPI00336AD91F
MPTRKGISPGNNAHREGSAAGEDASRWDAHWKGCPPGMRHRQLPRPQQFIISGCLSIGAEKSPTECAVKGSQTMNVISAIFALLGIVAFIVDLNLNGLYRSSFNYYSYLVLLAGNGISIVLLIFTILEFCIAVATANFWCRATRLSSNEAMLIVPSATRVDLAVPPAELPQPPSYTELTAPEV